MKNPLLVSCMSVWALTILSGCGGDGGGTCGNTAACGGDIVGTWKITSSCISVDVSNFAPADCPTATAKAVGITITGTGTYNADLTFSGTSTITGSVAVTLPASCLTQNGITVTCAQLTQALQGDPTFTSISCVAAGSGCTCTGALPPDTSTSTGTYTTTAAGLLTETDTGSATPDQSDYCIKGNMLTVSPHPGSSMMGQTASGTITLTKQ